MSNGTSLAFLKKDMAVYLVVNEDGMELATNSCPQRAEKAIDWLNSVYDGKYESYRKQCQGKWSDDYSEGYYTVPVFRGVVLPTGTIEKLIGKKITWEDEPVKL